MKSILVVGHPYAALDHVAEVLRVLGLEVGVDHLKVDGGVGWHFATGRPGPENFKAVWHATLNPYAVFARAQEEKTDPLTWHWMTLYDDWLQLTAPHCNTIEIAAAASWVAWNNVCSDRLLDARMKSKHARRFQVEDEWWPQELALTINLEWNDRIKERIRVLRDADDRIKPPLKWPQDSRRRTPRKIWNKVDEMATRFGYYAAETTR